MNLDAIRFLKPLLEASWQASLVILLILLLRPLLGLRVPARWRSLLWSLVLLRLLIPAFMLPPSPTSLQNIAAVDRPFEEAAVALGQPGVQEPMQGELRRQGPAPDEAQSSSADIAPLPRQASRWWIAAIVWFSGTCVTAIWICVATARLHRRVRGDCTAADDSIEQVWLSCCDRLSLSNPPRLVATGCVESPALLGLWRPTLLIPKGADFSREDWEHVFMHELAHFRRCDHWMQGLQLLALCAHWFNPLVWLGFRFLRADRELAADEWALRHLEERRSIAYGHTLLKVLSAQSGHPLTPGMVGIMEDAAQMKQRLRHIVAFAPRRIVGSLAGVACALALAAIVLGRQAEHIDLTHYQGLSPAEILVNAARSGDQPVVERMLADGVDIDSVASVRGERTALGAAVAANQLDIVRLLTERGADFLNKPENGDVPLVITLKRGATECAEYLLSRGATCAPELLSAAEGEAASIEEFVTREKPTFEHLKTLCEIAAVHGHARLYGFLADAIRLLPNRSSWESGNDLAVIAVARTHRAVLEEMLSRDSGIHGGVVRFAAAAAQHEGMREWLESKNFNVPEYSDGERLIDAAEREDLPQIRRLLAAGVDVNYRGESDWTPITKSATWGCPKAVKLLLENNADPNTLKHHHPALRLAKTPEIADLLFAAGANMNVKGGDRLLISYCVAFGPTEMVEWFLSHGVDPVQAEADGRTLLFEAGNAEIARLLINNGADVHATRSGGRTTLHEIASYGRNAPAVMRVLLEHGADPNASDDNGCTPLMVARDGESVDVLVEFGADVNAVTNDGYNVLKAHSHMAEASRIEALLRHGVKLDLDEVGPYLLAHAARFNQIDLVKFLLAQGVDPNVPSPINPQSDSRWTPLSTVISGNGLAIAKLLIEYGADGTEHMPGAVLMGRPQLVRLLWENGVRTISELCYAVTQSEPLPVLEKLLSKGIPVDSLLHKGVTPLCAAAVLGQLETVKFLIERGADPNADRYPALSIAATRGKDQVVAYLLSHGGKATPNLVATVASNSNPYQSEAPIEHFNKITKLLLDHGALSECTEEDAANILIAATMTRNPGGNPVVVKMLLDHGLSVHSQTTRGSIFGSDKPEGASHSVIDIEREARESGRWEVKPEVAALLREAAEKESASTR